MQQRLIDYFLRFATLSPEESEAIRASMSIRTFPKGTMLLQEGQVSNECYFVLEGCVRQYYLIDGEEKTDRFFTEDDWIVSMDSFSRKVPAEHNWICCEETSLVIGNEQKENTLYERFPRFETISRHVMGQLFAGQQKLMASYLTDTPEQRYLKLLESHPDLFQRIPQYHIASYIGVKPESLSRIRKRIFSREQL
jgi:CRP-like cAMP-binding protein